MKINKVIFSFVSIIVFLSSSAFACDDSFFGIGAELFRDKYSKKTLIVKVFPDSPAQRQGLVAGDEIVAVDGKRVRNLEIYDTVSKIRGEEGTTVKLLIKKNFFIRKTVEITREKITPEQEPCDIQFNRLWAQIAPADYGWYKPFDEAVVKKLSFKFKRLELPKINYWIERKNSFTAGYDSCSCDFSCDSANCMYKLMEREIKKTSLDMKLYKKLRMKY